VQQPSPQAGGQSETQVQASSRPVWQTPSGHSALVQSSGQIDASSSGMTQQPSPQKSPKQSSEHVQADSTAKSQQPSPQTAGQSWQLQAVSPNGSQQPSPQKPAPIQSEGHEQKVSPPMHIPSPQPTHMRLVASHIWPSGHGQSEAQLSQFSPMKQIPSPQPQLPLGSQTRPPPQTQSPQFWQFSWGELQMPSGQLGSAPQSTSPGRSQHPSPSIVKQGSPGQLHTVSCPLHVPSLQQLPFTHVSPSAHAHSSQFPQFSPNPGSHAASLHCAGQSTPHVGMLSPPEQQPSPQLSEQSPGQVQSSSPKLQAPSPLHWARAGSAASRIASERRALRIRGSPVA